MRLVDCFVTPLAYTAYIVGTADEQHPDYGQLGDLLQRSLAEGEKMSMQAGYTTAEYDSARFAVCAWIDEAVLCSGLPDRDLWSAELLQRRIYNTTRAGEEFYQKLQSIGEDMQQVKAVYYHCLALGFKGRFFSPDSEKDLTAIKQQTLKSLKGNGSMLSTDSSLTGFFPDSYPNNQPNRRKKLPQLAISSITLLLVLAPLLFILLTYLSYNSLLNELTATLFRMEFR